jgi:predicted transcriptional regulator
MRGVVIAGVLVLAFAVPAYASDNPTVPPLPVSTADATKELGQASRIASDAVPQSGQPTGVPAGALPAAVPADPALPASSPLPDLVGAGLVAAAGIAAWFVLGSRFSTPAEVLQNEVRQAIYVYLRQRVGANLKQITDDLRLTTTNAIWHLRKLEDAGLIHSRRFNGYKVFYPAEGGVEARKLSLSLTALANENARSVFEFVVSNPGTHQREIARALAVNHGTVRWHLKKLRRAEVLAETRSGKTSVYFPTDTGVAALASFREQHATSGPVATHVVPVP